MYLIQNITSDSKQTKNLILEDGSILTFTIYFVPMQYGWFITNLTYGDFVLNGLRVCNNPNMLFQWKNVLPFGMACFSRSNREPSQQQDFVSGNSNLYILTSAEVEEYSEFLANG